MAANRATTWTTRWKHTVLIIEDEPTYDRFLPVWWLEAAGFSVESATNGEAGIQKAGELSPDLILLDVMMPVVDGWGDLGAP